MVFEELDVQDKILLLEELLESYRAFKILHERPEQPMISCIRKISLKIGSLTLNSFARSVEKVTVSEHIE